MKRICLLLITFLILTICISAFADRDISLYINNTEITCDVPPKIVNSRTLVPVRAIFDAFGAEVSWNDALKQATISGNKKIVFTIGSNTATVDGKSVFMDTSALIINNRTMVPLRFISETLGYSVKWDDASSSVYITQSDSLDNLNISKITEINLTDNNENNNTFEIKYTGKTAPNLFYLSYSNCIVMDFYDTQLALNDGKIKIGTEFVNEVRYAIHDEYARVVIECNGNKQYTTTFKNGIYQVVVGSVSTKDEEIFESIDKEQNNSSSNNTSQDGPQEFTEAQKAAITKEFLKTRDENNLLVVIDAGHGGSDPGAVYKDANGNEVFEKTPNLYISQKLSQILTERGINHVMVRNSDVFVDLIERSTFANNKDADIFVSVHNNAVENPDVSGSMVLYNGDATFSKYGITGKEIATYINNEIKELVPITDRGIVSRPGLSVLKRTAMPAVLIECAFGTNLYDLSLITDESKMDLFAEAIANGVEQALNIMKTKIIEAKSN